MAVAMREGARTLAVFELLAMRNAFGVALLTAAMLWRPTLRHQVVTRRPLLHLYRNFMHFLGQYTWSTAVATMPFAIVFAIEFTMPIWLAILAVPILGERLTPGRAAAIGFGFVGVLLIMRPGVQSLAPNAWIPLAAAVFFAMTTIGTKKLTATETTFGILFWMNLLQLPMNLVFTGLDFPLRITGWTWLPVLGVCVTGFTAHFCLTNAFRHGDAILVTPLDFLRLPLIALIGWAFYAEPLDPWVLAGGCVILAGIMGNLWVETRAFARTAPPPGPA